MTRNQTAKRTPHPNYNRDVLYISNASLAELQKFLNLVGAIVGPFATFQVITE